MSRPSSSRPSNAVRNFCTASFPGSGSLSSMERWNSLSLIPLGESISACRKEGQSRQFCNLRLPSILPLKAQANSLAAPWKDMLESVRSANAEKKTRWILGCSWRTCHAIKLAMILGPVTKSTTLSTHREVRSLSRSHLSFALSQSTTSSSSDFKWSALHSRTPWISLRYLVARRPFHDRCFSFLRRRSSSRLFWGFFHEQGSCVMRDSDSILDCLRMMYPQGPNNGATSQGKQVPRFQLAQDSQQV